MEFPAGFTVFGLALTSCWVSAGNTASSCEPERHQILSNVRDVVPSNRIIQQVVSRIDQAELMSLLIFKNIGSAPDV